MTTETHTGKTHVIINSQGIANIWYNPNTNHHSLHAAVPFKAGDIIVNFYAATTLNHPTYLTVQTGSDTHITLAPAFLQYINHSCDPNVFFDTAAMQLVCIQPVDAGNELCFFYPSAEWEMAQPFICSCGSKDCLQLINGAAHLSADTLAKYRLTDFILQKTIQNPRTIL